jgi:hypothetical protein
MRHAHTFAVSTWTSFCRTAWSRRSNFDTGSFALSSAGAAGYTSCAGPPPIPKRSSPRGGTWPAHPLRRKTGGTLDGLDERREIARRWGRGEKCCFLRWLCVPQRPPGPKQRCRPRAKASPVTRYGTVKHHTRGAAVNYALSATRRLGRGVRSAAALRSHISAWRRGAELAARKGAHSLSLLVEQTRAPDDASLQRRGNTKISSLKEKVLSWLSLLWRMASGGFLVEEWRRQRKTASQTHDE